MDNPFDGQADYTLDAKNRLTVPARYRGSLEGGLVLAKDIEPCAAIWPAAGFDDFRSRALEGMNPMGQRARTINAYFSANALRGSLDSAGRVAMPPWLLQHGALGKDVTVVGVGDHLQIWDRAKWTEHNERLAQDIFSLSAALDDIPASQ
ncbi:MAG: hypothetical protein HZB46_13555 [Solirubrobacterales bacterium]|nr:hypothetical protein [Solirubrobacterales bacterium]